MFEDVMLQIHFRFKYSLSAWNLFCACNFQLHTRKLKKTISTRNNIYLEVIFYPPCSVKKNCKKPNISFTLIFLLPEFTDWIKIKLFRNMLHNAIFPIWVNVVSKVMDMYVKGLFQTQLCSTMHYDPLNYRIKYTTKSILHKLSFSSYFMLLYVNVNNRTWGYFAFKSRDSDHRSLSLLK